MIEKITFTEWLVEVKAKTGREYSSLNVETDSMMSKDKQSAVAYVVKDEHTLGYIFDAQPGLMGVLSSNKNGHHPNGGPVSTFGANIRPAMVEDFATFRVVVPPDFKSEQCQKVVLTEPQTYAEWQMLSPEQMVYWPDNSETPYSKADFLRLCKGNDEVAYNLYAVCEWQCPETVLDEDSFADDSDKCFPTCH